MAGSTSLIPEREHVGVLGGQLEQGGDDTVVGGHGEGVGAHWAAGWHQRADRVHAVAPDRREVAVDGAAPTLQPQSLADDGHVVQELLGWRGAPVRVQILTGVGEQTGRVDHSCRHHLGWGDPPLAVVHVLHLADVLRAVIGVAPLDEGVVMSRRGQRRNPTKTDLAFTLTMSFIDVYRGL